MIFSEIFPRQLRRDMGRYALGTLYSGFPAFLRITMAACRQQTGLYPAWKSAWNKVLKYSGIILYAILMHSNPMLSGPGALVDEEDFMAFWISSVVTFGHGSG
jgi:hypothetical protein